MVRPKAAEGSPLARLGLHHWQRLCGRTQDQVDRPTEHHPPSQQRACTPLITLPTPPPLRRRLRVAPAAPVESCPCRPPRPPSAAPTRVGRAVRSVHTLLPPDRARSRSGARDCDQSAPRHLPIAYPPPHLSAAPKAAHVALCAPHLRHLCGQDNHGDQHTPGYLQISRDRDLALALAIWVRHCACLPTASYPPELRRFHHRPCRPLQPQAAALARPAHPSSAPHT